MLSTTSKLFFDLGHDQWHGFETESVNVSHVGNEKFRLENSPFFAKCVSFKDIVAANKVEDRLVFVNTVLSSGHSTYRILLKEKEGKSEEWLTYWQALQDIGCSYEESRELALRMLAIDVPSETNVTEACRLLQIGEQADVWEFEEGHCGHIGR